MTDAVDTVAEGRVAWQQIKENSRRSWDDWLKVGKAIAFGRAEAMRQSKANRPVGTGYVRVFGAFLRDQGFTDTTNQERDTRTPARRDGVARWPAGGAAQKAQPSKPVACVSPRDQGRDTGSAVRSQREVVAPARQAGLLAR